MRTPLRHGALIVIVAVGVMSLSTGCRSGGWKMPGSNWVSWGKKKPPTSSIAGTHEMTQPPSVAVPPYPPDDSVPSSSASLAAAGARQAEQPSIYQPSTAMPTGVDNAVQPAAATGFPTGPYGTGGAGSIATQTQQGFYRTATPDNAGPIASTADARGAYGAVSPPAYDGAAGAPPAGTPFGPDLAPSGGNLAPITTPATPTGSDYSYPETSPAPVAPVSAPGTYQSPAPPTYSAAAYPLGTPSALAPASPYNTYGPPVAPGGSAVGNSYPPGTSAVPSVAPPSGQYRPGSTSRNSNLFSPTSGSGTYSR